MKLCVHTNLLAVLVLAPQIGFAEELPAPDFAKDIAPLLTKYCAGCHNADDRDGKLSLNSFGELEKGGKSGPALIPGNSKGSRIIRLMTGAAKPKMPPEDNPAPKADEIARIAAWIDAGARGPGGKEISRRILVTPKIAPVGDIQRTISDVEFSPDGKHLAVARFAMVEIQAVASGKVVRKIGPHPGKVNAVSYSHDGKLIVTASGVTGLYGLASVFDAESGKLLREFEGHRDSMYAAKLSPDGKLLATASYDKRILLWDSSNGKLVRTIEGHNDAVYDIAFSPDGSLLASASGDETVKVWQVSTGKRLDTMSQPQGEQYTVTFSPDGRFVLAGGADNRIRVWRLESRTSAKINPQVFSRFAHEGAVIRLVFSNNGQTLVSAAEDRSIKLWETKTFTERHAYPVQADTPHALAVAPDGRTIAVSAGVALSSLKMASIDGNNTGDAAGVSSKFVQDERDTKKVTEAEPNNDAASAQVVTIPASISGVIHGEMKVSADEDLYRIHAKKGEVWIAEVNAARSKSPLDSKIDVLDSAGKPVLRTLLQATRDSYIKFRGVDSNSRDCRVHNWEEMTLNEYLYLNGEVVKLYLAPRGPDSGFAFYPHAGNRRCYFDTSPSSHALHEPCYIVQPHPPGTKLIPNGLPVFPIYYENDDDGWRQLGADSRLTFTAPDDGDYLIRIRDVRGFQGDNFKYTLNIRPAQPDFTVSLSGANATINAGSGKEFSVTASRMDGFDGPIRVDISNLPAGFSATNPVVIQAGHDRALGTLNAVPNAPTPSADALKKVNVTATASVLGTEVVKPVNNFGTIKLAGKPKLLVSVFPTGGKPSTLPERKWTVARPTEVKSPRSTKLSVLEDGSVLASGNVPETDSYAVAIEATGKVHAIKLEVLGHDSLPSKAPGRADPNGNFVLSEFKVIASPLKGSGGPVPVKIKSAYADYSQAGWDVAGTIDGKKSTGWAIAEKKDDKFPVKKDGNSLSHWAVFEFEQPVGFEAGTRLLVVLDHDSDVKSHTLGRFRLSTTSDGVGDPPPIPELVIAPGETITATVQIQRNGFNGRVRFEAINHNLPHGVIVDNIGLSGLLIVEGTSERTFFLTAAKWVPETSRTFHLKAQAEGNQTSWPIRLRVKRD